MLAICWPLGGVCEFMCVVDMSGRCGMYVECMLYKGGLCSVYIVCFTGGSDWHMCSMCV